VETDGQVDAADTMDEAKERVRADLFQWTTTKIGRFTVLEQIGEGGMATVYAAYDPQLDRRIAIKVLRSDKGKARLLREAQALARLQHPNVVQVFEVVERDDDLAIAMEFVDGEDLQAYYERSPPWREVIRLVLDAARGLAAAHAQGIVHRDVKPHNVLLDGDGRARVADFGLVRLDAKSESASSPGSPEDTGAIDSDLTREGAMMGTPAYMAPELYAGGQADERSDQFGLAVTLYRGLFGKLPFRGADLSELATAIQDNEPEVVASTSVPRAVRAVVARGLRRNPDDRFPSIAEMIGVLERAAKPRSATRPVVFGAAVTMGVVAWVSTRDTAGSDTPCAGAGSGIESIWNADVRARVAARFTAVAGDFGRRQADRVVAALSAYAEAWAAHRVATCRATKVDHVQSDTLYDLRMACLERRLDEVTAAVALVAGEPDAEVVRNAQRVAFALTPVSACDDADALRAATPLPDDPERRAEVRDLQTRVSAVEAVRYSGRYKKAHGAALTLVQDARAADYPPVLASALFVLGAVERDAGDFGAAQTAFLEVTRVAASAADDDTAARAWLVLLQLIAADLKAPSRAKELIPVAESAVLRAGAPVQLEVDLNYRISVLRDELGQREGAMQAILRAEAVVEPLVVPGGDPHHRARYADVLFQRSVLEGVDNPEASGRLLRRAIVIWGEVYGPDHPEVAFGHNNLAELHRTSGDLEGALREHQRALAIRRGALQPDHPTISASLLGVGQAEMYLGRLDDARRHLEEALVIQRRSPEDATALATLLMTLAPTLERQGHVEEAVALYDEAIAGFEGHGLDSLNLGIAYLNRAGLHNATKDHKAALAGHTHALAVMEKHVGDAHPFIIHPLLGQGVAHVGLGKHDAAIAPLTRALAIEDPSGASALQTESAKLYLGLALWGDPKEQARGLALVRQAHPALVALGDEARVETEVAARFLAQHTDAGASD